MVIDGGLSSKENLSYYETEAKNLRLFGSLREISLAENILRNLPRKFINVLDIGCGEGYLLHQIHKRYPSASKYGMDITNGRTITTRKNVPSAIVLRADAIRLPFLDDSFDVVICSEVIEHILDYQSVINEIARVSRGRIIITVPNDQALTQIICPKCNTPHYLDGHINRFDESNIIKLFQRKDVNSIKIIRFHTIYSYNSVTLKVLGIMRLSLDRALVYLSRYISFLKPNFLMVVANKVPRIKAGCDHR